MEEYKIDTKQKAYTLGYIWADGHLEQKGNYKRCGIECAREDLESVKELFLSLPFEWHISYRNRKKWKPQMCLRTSDKSFCTFLFENDFTSKSILSADKVLNKIPDEFKNYFFLGLSDGDGCFFISKNKINVAYNISSCFDQDWTYFENFLQKHNIYYSIKKVKNKTKYSYIYLQRCKEVVKLGKILYLNYEEDRIGLLRKYNKFLEIKNNYNLRKRTKIKIQ